MKKPRPLPEPNPDALDFYLRDHLNVSRRLKDLDFALIATSPSVYVRAVSLARGYRNERAHRPASTCLINARVIEDGVHHTIVQHRGVSKTVDIFFKLGWFRKRPKNPRKHYFITLPDGEFSHTFDVSEHPDLEEFTADLRDLIRVLNERNFENFEEICTFMLNWTGRVYLHSRFMGKLSRLERALRAIEKVDEPAYVPPPPQKPTRHRMGRPRVNQGRVSYRGR